MPGLPRAQGEGPLSTGGVDMPPRIDVGAQGTGRQAESRERDRETTLDTAKAQDDVASVARARNEEQSRRTLLTSQDELDAVNKRNETVVIRLNRPTRYDFDGGVMLVPGENNVDALAWRRLRQGHEDPQHPRYRKPNEVLQSYIDLKHITEVRRKGKARPLVNELGRVDAATAKLWIEAERSQAQLLAWRDNDTRPEMQQYINQRLETLRGTAPQSAGAGAGPDEGPVFDGSADDDDDDF